MVRLFVYGTLRRSSAHPMARFLHCRATFLAGVRVRGLRRKVNALHTGLVVGDGWVPGEIFALHQPRLTLAALDRYEGREYQRRLTRIRHDAGWQGQAWVYWFTGTAE